MPFDKLMVELVSALGEDEWQQLALDDLAVRLDEPAERIADAISAVRVVRAVERAFIGEMREPHTPSDFRRRVALMTGPQDPFEVVRRWHVLATDPADAVERAEPGKHRDVEAHRIRWTR